MISREIAKYSIKKLVHSRSRSLLTLASILVGITTIFIFVSFGWGLYDYIDSVASTGSANKVVIQPKGIGAPGADETFALHEEDLRAIKRTAGVYETGGMMFKMAEVQQEKTKKYTYLVAYDPQHSLLMDLYSIKIAKGRELKGGEMNKAVLGYNYQIKDKIFPRAYSLNEEIEINGRPTKIIGFYASVGNPQDDAQIYVTEDYFYELFPNSTKSYTWIIAEVDINDLNNTIQRIEKSLRNSRNIKEGNEDFFVQSFEAMIESYTSALDIVIAFVIFIALISVVVSSINTANTMITSVLERYKEIGVMKAIGSKNSQILNIFLFESSLLGLVAGIIGVLFGFIATSIAKSILSSLGWSFLAPHYSIGLFVGCIAFATITGAVSGLIPAMKASRINPVEALRYE